MMIVGKELNIGNFALFLLSTDFFQNFLQEHSIRVSNGLEPDQDWCFVRSDLGPNGLQRLSADEFFKFLVILHG